MMLTIRVEQEFDLTTPIDIPGAMKIFCEVCKYYDLMLDTNKRWYEKGKSRKKALQHEIVADPSVLEEIRLRWEKRYRKNYPFFGEGIWDGEPDTDSAGIDLTSSISSTHRRVNPMTLTIEFPINTIATKISLERMANFILCLLELNGSCTYLSVESGGYSFPDIDINGNEYKKVFKQVFPDRITCGWMLYIPHIVLPHFIPEAARVIPVMDGNKQKGTIVVSTEEIFDGNNKEHIEKANDIEIKLLDLGLLPLVTEL